MWQVIKDLADQVGNGRKIPPDSKGRRHDIVSAAIERFWTYLQIHSESPLSPFSFLVPEGPDGDKQKAMAGRAAGDWFPPREPAQNGGGFQAGLRDMSEQAPEQRLNRLAIIGSGDFTSCRSPHCDLKKLTTRKTEGKMEMNLRKLVSLIKYRLRSKRTHADKSLQLAQCWLRND